MAKKIMSIKNFFFKRKTCLKTTWRFRFLALAVISLFIILPHKFWLGNLFEFLTPIGEIEKVDLILAEGWANDKEIDIAVDLFKKGYGKYLMTNGYKILKFSSCYKGETWADVTREQIIIEKGINESSVISLRQTERGTYDAAISAKAYFETYNIRSIIIVTSGPHMARTYLTFRKVFGPSLKIIPVPVFEEWCLKDNWWKNHDGLEYVVREYIKLFFYWFKGYI